MLQSYMDIAINATDLSRENVGKMTESIAGIGLQGLLSMSSSLLNFSDELVHMFLKSSTGWVTIVGSIFALIFTVGGMVGTIRIFISAGSTFLTIAWGSIVFVYKLTSTPFGYLYQRVATLHVKQSQNNINNETPAIENVSGGARRRIRRTCKCRRRHSRKKCNKRYKKRGTKRKMPCVTRKR
jgi:hypothetical protein